MKKLLVVASTLALMFIMAVGVSAGTAQARARHAEQHPASTHRTTVTVSVTPRHEAGVNYRAVAKYVRRASGTSAPLLTPPPKCYYNYAAGTGHATYDNGVLATFDFNYNSHVSCPPSKAGQTMQLLQSQPLLYKDNKGVGGGKNGRCIYKAGGVPCIYAAGAGEFICAGPQCAGYYQVLSGNTLTLPPRWIWTSYNSNDCAILDQNRTLQCDGYSSVVQVPASG